MFGTCGDLDRCNSGASKAADRVFEQRIKPYYDDAWTLMRYVSPSDDEPSRRELASRIGGCPVCVLEDKPVFAGHLVEDVCCVEHGREIDRWLKDHKKRETKDSQVCREHRHAADEAWVLYRDGNTIEIAGQSIELAHVAFAFKRPTPTENEFWVDEDVWVYGSSDGVLDTNAPKASLHGPARYWWLCGTHPLDADEFEAYKFATRIEVEDGRWFEAILEADEQRSKEYVLLTNNCADVVRKVLTAYGVDLPPLSDLEKPAMSAFDWFPRIQGDLIHLKRARAAHNRPKRPRKKTKK